MDGVVSHIPVDPVHLENAGTGNEGPSNELARRDGHWDGDVDSADILLTDSTYRGSYEKCNCLHN